MPLADRFFFHGRAGGHDPMRHATEERNHRGSNYRISQHLTPPWEDSIAFELKVKTLSFRGSLGDRRICQKTWRRNKGQVREEISQATFLGNLRRLGRGLFDT